MVNFPKLEFEVSPIFPGKWIALQELTEKQKLEHLESYIIILPRRCGLSATLVALKGIVISTSGLFERHKQIVSSQISIHNLSKKARQLRTCTSFQCLFNHSIIFHLETETTTDPMISQAPAAVAIYFFYFF